MAKNQRGEVIPQNGATFKNNVCDQLMEQMRDNGVTQVTLELVAIPKRPGFPYLCRFVSKKGTNMEVDGETVADALYAACCDNENEEYFAKLRKVSQ